MDRLSALVDAITRHVPGEGMFDTEVPDLALIRADQPSIPTPAVYEPSVCLIAQGSKRVDVGSRSVLYDASRYLLVSVDLPLVGCILEASPGAPYLCCKVGLPRTMLAELVLAVEEPTGASPGPAVAVAPSDPALLDAVYRMVSLLDRPTSIPILAPLVQREIAYRLVTGPRGELLRRMATGDGHLGQISRAVEYIRTGFREALRVDDVAATAGMSVSSLHQHFKAVTSLTPLEYQKHLRLHEARRLMLAEGATASGAGFAVGYESPSQFSREYRRLFGAPPRQDIARLS